MNASNLKVDVYDLDDELIEKCKNLRTRQLDVYFPDHIMVVLGRGSRPDVELNVRECLRDNVDIRRRHGGGCAVVLDPGNIIVSLVLPAEGLVRINEKFESISNWLIDGLEQAGLKGVHREGVCDLVIENRKIGGACMQRKREYCYYSLSLLFKPNLNLIDRYLQHPPREPSYRKGRKHRDFIRPIGFMPGSSSQLEFIEALKANLNIRNL